MKPKKQICTELRHIGMRLTSCASNEELSMLELRLEMIRMDERLDNVIKMVDGLKVDAAPPKLLVKG